MEINFYKGTKQIKDLYHSFYIHPTLKIQPYKKGFELCLWWITSYISIRITWYR